jgi:hypothetical protein
VVGSSSCCSTIAGLYDAWAWAGSGACAWQVSAVAAARLQVVPGLDPKTPIYAASFVMELVQRRMAEYSMWNPNRFHTMEMRQRFQMGPFE